MTHDEKDAARRAHLAAAEHLTTVAAKTSNSISGHQRAAAYAARAAAHAALATYYLQALKP